MVRKPDGVAEMEDLLRTLVRIPKKELDKQLAKTKAKARAKYKKQAAKRKKKS
jgi:hypothetical protein